MSSMRQPSSSATICDSGLMALAVVAAPVAPHLAVLLHAHGDALERAEAGAFDVGADADADMAALLARLLPGAPRKPRSLRAPAPSRWPRG